MLKKHGIYSILHKRVENLLHSIALRKNHIKIFPLLNKARNSRNYVNLNIAKITKIGRCTQDVQASDDDSKILC
jgi:hypothetical protein